MTDPAAKTLALSAEEEAKVRARAGQSVTWFPDTMEDGYRVKDALHHAVHDRDGLLATLDAARTDYEARIAALEGALRETVAYAHILATRGDRVDVAPSECLNPICVAAHAALVGELATPPTAVEP